MIPEVLQHDATPEKLAHWLISLKIDDNLRGGMKAGFEQIRSMLKAPTDGPTASMIVREMLIHSGGEEITQES